MKNKHARMFGLDVTGMYFLAVLITVNGFLFQLDEQPTEPPIPPGTIGCYKDSSQSPDLAYAVTTSSKMLTGSSCRSSCRELWYKYAALQNGDTCWCGNDYGRYGKVDFSECSQASCIGNPREHCGGPQRNLVTRSGFSLEYGGRVGKCWNVDTSLGLANLVYVGDLNSHKHCKSVCGAFRKKFAAVRNGNECWCGDEIFGNSWKEGNDCNEPCTGNPLEKCGSDGSGMFIMHSERDERDQGLLIPEGCYIGGKSIDLTPLLNPDDDQPLATDFNLKTLGPMYNHKMTRELCKHTCKKIGCKLAGVTNGNECWCGTMFNPKVWLTDDDKCNVACAGNPGQTCGSALGVFIMDSGLEGQSTRFVDFPPSLQFHEAIKF